MQLRWYIERNNVTAEMVEEERLISGESFAKCKKRLLNESAPRLQYFVPYQPPLLTSETGAWVDVPTMIFTRNESALTEDVL